MSKKVTHVVSKDGKTWCGKAQGKKTPFDAKPCPECKEMVRASISKE